MRSDTTIQSSVSSVDQQDMDQFAQMRTMLSSFIGPKQETTRTAFCNYLASEVEALEDKDFQRFKNEAVKYSKQHAEQSIRKEPSAPAKTATDTF